MRTERWIHVRQEAWFTTIEGEPSGARVRSAVCRLESTTVFRSPDWPVLWSTILLRHHDRFAAAVQASLLYCSLSSRMKISSRYTIQNPRKPDTPRAADNVRAEWIIIT
jgi:hypothetical protein